MSDFDSLHRLKARQAEFEAFEQRIRSVQGQLNFDWVSVILAGSVALIVLVLVLWLWWASRGPKVNEHPLLAKMRYGKLPFTNVTRQRLQRAGELFTQGWLALQSTDPKEQEKCLELFTQAVELDEMACGWKKDYEESLERIGELFTDPEPGPDGQPPPRPDNQTIYNSMMSEAYLVLVLYTVVALYGKPSGEAAEDFDVVKTRLDCCVKLQPKNPVPYKLRADWCLRFPEQADRELCIRDFEKAISLLEADQEGTAFKSHNLDPQALRRHLLSYCHYQLGMQMQHKKQYADAFQQYEAALQAAEPDFVHLPEIHFNLCILTIMKIEADDNRSSMLATAMQHYRDGSVAVKKLQRWTAVKPYEASKKLAKQLLSKLTKAGFTTKNIDAAEKKNK